MLHVINLFKELREVAHKRLTTTVEEDRRAQVLTRCQHSRCQLLPHCSLQPTCEWLTGRHLVSSNVQKALCHGIWLRRKCHKISAAMQEHFEDVKLREEKAMSEQQQLQQKLKLDRIQWQKQTHLARSQEDALVANLSSMRMSHAATLHELRSDNQSLEQAFDSDYEQCVSQTMHTGSSSLCLYTFSVIIRHVHVQSDVLPPPRMRSVQQ